VRSVKRKYLRIYITSTTFMWDKRKGKPKYDQKNNNSWLGPYIIKKKSEKEKYYLTAMDGRKMPLPVDGSLLLTLHSRYLTSSGPRPQVSR
jgi:hypothetical protein